MADRTKRKRTSRPPAGAGRKPSIGQVAERAGVSTATISRVVNGVSSKVSRETEARVREAIEELGYRPASVGRALRQGESRLVALLAPNLANPAMAAIAASTESALRQAGYAMVVCDTHDRPDFQDEYLLEMRAQFARAIVFLGAVESPQLARFRAAGERLIFVNRRDPGGTGSPYIGIDNRRAGAEIAAMLVDDGARRIGAIHGPLASSATRDRVTGFRSGLADRDREAAGIIAGDGTDHLAIGYEAASTLLSEGPVPDALFCLSDLIAFGVARRLREAGEDALERIRIVGFDDTPLNDWIAPWLTSVRVPYEDFGPAIVAALDADVAGEPVTETVLKHRIIRRGALAGAD